MLDDLKRLLLIKGSELSLVRLKRALTLRLRYIFLFLDYYRPFGFPMINRKRLRSFQKKHEGERCFIVANGPSLKHMNMDLLKNEFTIGMNRIYLMTAINGFIPNYLTCIDKKSQIEQFHEELNDLSIPCFFNYELKRKFSLKANQYFA